MRKLETSLTKKEARSRYERFVNYMAECRAALLIPITGFDDYPELAQVLKEVEGGTSEGLKIAEEARKKAEEESERHRW